MWKALSVAFVLAVSPAGAQTPIVGSGPPDTGNGCTISGGSVNQIITNSGSNGCQSDTLATVNAGALALGASGSLGTVTLGNASSGTIKLQPVAGALGTPTLTLPAATDTFAVLAATQTLTNKTVAFSSNTLTGVAPLASPMFSGTVTGPDSGTWTSGGLNAVILGASTPAAATHTTLTASSTVTFSGLSSQGVVCNASSGVLSTSAVGCAGVVQSVTTGGTGDTGAAWSTYTPVVACTTSGTITTDTVTGRYKTLGKTVFIQINVNIATLGTCLGNLTITLPGGISVNATGTNYPLAAYNASVATTPLGAVANSSSGIILPFVTAPAANNYYIAGTFEST
jgi:hypothetical protein